jgi:hypothetical protein
VGKAAPGRGDALPAEEDVADSLHQMLVGDDTFALVTVFVLAGVAGQHRALRLLGLQQQQRLQAVVGFHQQDPRLGADAADADDLAGHPGQGEPLCQPAPVGRQGLRVPGDQAAKEPVDSVDVEVPGQFFERDDQRRVADDLAPPVLNGDQFRQRLSAVAGAGLSHLGLGPARSLLGPVRFEPGEGVFDVEAGIPDIQDRHGSEFPHRGAVSRRGRKANPAPFLGAQTVVAACHRRARHQPLDVSLERAGQRLIEVVQIKDQPPFR